MRDKVHLFINAANFRIQFSSYRKYLINYTLKNPLNLPKMYRTVKASYEKTNERTPEYARNKRNVAGGMNGINKCRPESSPKSSAWSACALEHLQ